MRLPPNSQVPVIIDWVTKGDWALLGAALPSHLGRAMVFAETLCLKKKLTLTQNRIELGFIRYLERLFEEAGNLGLRFIVVADRGFGKSNPVAHFRDGGIHLSGSREDDFLSCKYREAHFIGEHSKETGPRGDLGRERVCSSDKENTSSGDHRRRRGPLGLADQYLGPSC